jgi:DNA-binding transcriptional MerR regulator
MTELGDGDESRGRRIDKAPAAFRTISEVAVELDVPQHVLRFWESKFAQLRPLKRGGGRRYYRPEDVELLRGIRRLLYGDGYTIKGVQKLLREQGARALAAAPPPAAKPGDPGDRLREAVGRALDELAALRDILRRRRL